MATEFEHPTAVKLKAEVRANPWTVHWDIEHRGRQLVEEGEYRRLARRKTRTLTIKLPPTADEWRTLACDMATPWRRCGSEGRGRSYLHQRRSGNRQEPKRRALMPPNTCL